MQPINPKFIIILVLLTMVLHAGAQTCSGSLGDPVINETFGAGATYGTGPPLSAGITTFKYTAETCPADGYYTIASSLGLCFGGTWQTVPHDHTGNLNGYMMIINSSFDPGLFYTQKAPGNRLCPNTQYEFAAWIMNVIRDRADTKGDIEPNITFSIETADGRVLQTYNTGNIAQADIADFHQYGTFFTSPADGADVIVKMINNAPGGYGNDLILDDITFKPCGPVIQSGFGSFTSTADKDLCIGESAGYLLKATQTGYSDPSYQWQVNLNNGAGWVDIAGATDTTLAINFTASSPVGKYQYRVGVLAKTNTSLNCRIYSSPLTVNVNALPVVVISTETVVCENAPLQLTATGGSSYSWAGPNNFTSAEQSPVVSYTPGNALNGVYTVTVTSDKGCVANASTRVTVLPKVSPVISPDAAICEGDAVQLMAGGGVNYKWTPAEGLDRDDIPNPVARPNVTTQYHVSVDNGGCIDQTKTVTVTVLKRPAVNAGPDVKIQEGETVKLTGTVTGDNITYYWTPADYLDNPASLTPLATPPENITYTLHAESQDNCGMATDQVFIRVYRKITIPDTFSPNNDGKNDLWNIAKLDTYPESVLTVFTRSGQQVFRSVGNSRPWDGNYNGQQLPATTYYYVLDLKNNTPVRAGWILLIR